MKPFLWGGLLISSGICASLLLRAIAIPAGKTAAAPSSPLPAAPLSTPLSTPLSAPLSNRLALTSPQVSPSLSSAISPSGSPAMSSAATVLKTVRLIAREAPEPPLGVPVDPNRDRAFATVFLDLENPAQTPVTLVVERVQIWNATGDRLHLEQASPQPLTLQPLENAVIDIHLAGPDLFEGSDRLKAVVIYQVAGQTNSQESAVISLR